MVRKIFMIVMISIICVVAFGQGNRNQFQFSLYQYHFDYIFYSWGEFFTWMDKMGYTKADIIREYPISDDDYVIELTSGEYVAIMK